MEISLAQKAVALAIRGDWNEAVKVNLQIVGQNPQDVDALNRLARSYSELGKIKLAKETAQKVIKLDPFNSIAGKCLEKWKAVNKYQKSAGSVSISSESFLEESGKTKLVSLVNTGDSKVFAMLDPGEEVKISSYSHKVSVVTVDDKYIGRLPDDLAARLRNLIKAGNKYQVLVKSVQPKEITVFMREVERGIDAPNTPSFPTEKIEYVAFTPPELIHKEEPEGIIEESVED